MTGTHSAWIGIAFELIRWPVIPEVALGHVAHPRMGDTQDLAHDLAFKRVGPCVDFGQDS